jgi:outer membrane protein assembly factor BamB
VIYASGSGVYAPQGTEKPFVMSGKPVPSSDGKEVMSWIYTHNNPFYPKDNKPLIWAWDLDTGKLAWSKDFSELGAGGNDCGLCLMDGKVFYSTFFGYAASLRPQRGLPRGPNGLTACLDPKTGKVLWMTDKYYVTAGCTISGRDGRVYLGGYNQPNEGTNDRHIWCLDARDGSLIWQSEPVRSAVNVTRFTLSGSLLLGANFDMVDLADNNRLVSTGPAIDSRECLGAVLSNGRVFYISQASAMAAAQVSGAEAKSFKAPWERR